MSQAMVEHIVKTPGVCGGRACIAGHRIRVLDIAAWHERRGLSAEEIVYQFPGLTRGGGVRNEADDPSGGRAAVASDGLLNTMIPMLLKCSPRIERGFSDEAA